MSKYSVAIIGCGSIGALKDSQYDYPGGDAVLTHAHAFWQHPDTELVLFSDVDMTRAKQASEKWQGLRKCITAPYALSDYHNPGDLDIIVVSTPTETHHDVLMRVLELRPRVVVAEKPLCSTLKEAKEVHDAYAAAGVPILVNYTRRFDPVAADVFDGLRDGAYGKIWHARCLYGRGLRRDGCHAVDIFSWVFGAPKGLAFNHQGITDYLHVDPSYTLRLEYEGCQEVYMVATDSQKYGMFDLDFITEAGVLRFSDWGKTVQHFHAEPEKTYGQYNALSPSAPRVTTGLTKALLYMADNCVRHLRDSEPLLCTSADALRVHEVLEEVK